MTARNQEKRDLPDISTVLRAIDEDKEERSDKASQMRLLRELVLWKYQKGVPADEVEAITERLRNKLNRDVNNYAPYILGKGKRPKSQTVTDLFKIGSTIFKSEYLDRMSAFDQHDADSDSEGADQRPESEAGSQDEYQPPDLRYSSHGQRKDSLVGADIEDSRKRKRGDSYLELVPKSSDATTALKLKLSGGFKQPQPRKDGNLTVPTDRATNGELNVVPSTSLPTVRVKPEHQQLSSPEGPVATRTSQPVPNQTLQEHTPVIPPTDEPARPTEIVITPDENWVQAQMKKIESNIWHATLSYLQEHNMSEDAEADFVDGPAEPLRDLYQVIFGKSWQVVIFKFRNDSVRLEQAFVVMALFGASIYRQVFKKKLPWDLQGEVQDVLGKNQKYFDAVMRDFGQQPEAALRYMVGKQAADAEFQETTMAQYAQELVGSSMLHIQPHLRKLSRKKTPTKSIRYKNWHQYLEKAFEAAILLKQIMESSSLGPFTLKWPKAGDELDLEQHRLQFELDEPESARQVIAHAVLPMIARIVPSNDKLVYCRALVLNATIEDATAEAKVSHSGILLAAKQHLRTTCSIG
ncbi:hypothetical protein Slin15195_G032960 [Septoria linicola]|uniref:Uncharacterized protein n=1 Tax=Septoria linicola TaxID=215465 RepID=A0A9Q9AQ15_9PEZI|nr:hypothetical protein Slin14017_G031980 [Septoria linicola]USW49977.1 hypothetical protein Slin15195_G032960 [Septoria linicola]